MSYHDDHRPKSSMPHQGDTMEVLTAPYPTSDLGDELGYDANHNDPRQYCKHGTFIGSAWGPDYMCGYCELGTEPPTPAEVEATRIARLERTAERFDRMVATIRASHPYSATFAAWLMDTAHDPYWTR